MLLKLLKTSRDSISPYFDPGARYAYQSASALPFGKLGFSITSVPSDWSGLAAGLMTAVARTFGSGLYLYQTYWKSLEKIRPPMPRYRLTASEAVAPLFSRCSSHSQDSMAMSYCESSPRLPHSADAGVICAR